ncbi:potassium transporter Kef [Microbacterium sp.]|uniref:potassium transporter Kef n=1 Tax=Microbacterium sp. TaxID=51671 RepID=UPI0026350C7D|nr:potassium transporter Kef [Microbacterium sp.]
MITRPCQLANEGVSFAAPAADLAGVGLEVDVAADAVRRAGGDVELFTGTLSAGIEADPTARGERQYALDLVAWAGWRAGVLALRDDALRRLDAVDTNRRRAAAAAVLLIPPDEIDEFRTRQRHDRYWWPARGVRDGYVFSVGGFQGLDGVWIRPPERVERLSAAGAFGILVAGDWWRLDGDVWGSRLTLLGPEEPASETKAVFADDGVTLVISEDTHVAWLHVRDR